MKIENSSIAVCLSVIWHRGMPEVDKVLSEIHKRFTVLKQFDVIWWKRDYIRNFVAFYGRKCFSMWFGKTNRAGTGPLRALLVCDERPVLTEECGWEGVSGMLRKENVFRLKRECRKMMRRSNVVHASVNEAETRHDLKALTGENLEDFLTRPDLDRPVVELEMSKPIPYVPFAHDLLDKGARFFSGKFKFNRVELFSSELRVADDFQLQGQVGRAF